MKYFSNGCIHALINIFNLVRSILLPFQSNLDAEIAKANSRAAAGALHGRSHFVSNETKLTSGLNSKAEDNV